MATYSQAGKFGPATVSGAPVGVPLRVTTASGSDAVLYRDASKNKTTGPVVQSDEAGNVTFFADPGTYTVRWTGGSTTVTVAGGTLESGGRVDVTTANLLTVGEETIPRSDMTSVTSVVPASGQMRFVYFTARKSERSTQVRVLTGATAAGATPTLCRVGLYSVAANGDLTLVAATANDTTLFAAATTAYTRSWSAPFDKVAGQRYALATLVVTAATAPNFAGAATIAFSVETAVDPQVGSVLSSQTDLPASISSGSLGGSGQRIYAVVLP